LGPFFTYFHLGAFANTPQVYYFAIFTNILGRFGWILYLPITGPNPDARIGIIGVAEVFRRFQWNFFRLENEHLGNVDQLRATREVPLPYMMDMEEGYEDGLRSRWFD
jgi:xenotropic and polytropic retrovirus receptor 1